MTQWVTRQDMLAQLRRSPDWDVIVIGGGATGLGTAVESVTRGYRTLLLEKWDFAKGTSSRSTKLIHGGVRYLAQGNLGLVREALYERGLLRQNAPHLVSDLTFVVPAYAWSSQLFYGLGLQVYDLLAGRLSFGRSHFLNQKNTLEHLPNLKPDALRGSITYQDGQFDDARLAITLLRTLLDHGGTALNYCPVVALLKRDDRIVGVRACDSETGDSFEFTASVVINATGVFVDAVRRLDDPAALPLLSPSQGVHLVVASHFLPGGDALLIPKTSDGRVLFAIPWHDRVVIGTTDTPVEDCSEEPRPLQAEIEFLLETIAEYLTSAPSKEDVLTVFAGLRPLVKANPGMATSALSREHVIQVSPSGLLTITGGKWTTYRRMGEDAIDRAVKLANLSPMPSVTVRLLLHGWTQTPAPQPLTVYGNDAEAIQSLLGANTPLHPRLPYSEAEIRWAARYELARTVEDALARRTRALFLDAIASLEAAPRVAAILAEELGKDDRWQQQQVYTYQTLVKGYLINQDTRCHLS